MICCTNGSGAVEVLERDMFKKVVLHEIGPRSPVLCKFSLELIEKVPSYFWTEAASSSGRMHPLHDLGEGGLARHSLMAYRWLRSLLDGSLVDLNEYVPAMIVATLFHDCCKRGLPNQVPSDHTLFEHPILSAKFIFDCSKEFLEKNKEFIDSTSEDEEWFKGQVALIASCVQSHMGKWNVRRNSTDIVLPLPKNNIQHMVHLADYCASRDFTTFDAIFFNDIFTKHNEGDKTNEQ